MKHRKYNPILINFFLLAIFSVLVFTGLLRHEIWLDEAHHWLLARDSESLKALWINTRYEGHPILWNFILFVITRFSTNVFFMQLTHLVIAVAAACVFLFYAPFKLIEKALFISGYFILYEYAVISRNYALMMLFFFLSLVLYCRKNYIGLGWALAVLANTHLFGLIISSCFFAMVAFELWSEKKSAINKHFAVGCIIFFAGAAISLWQIIPPADSTLIANAQKIPIIPRLGRTSAIFLKGFIPVPDFTNYRFWNSNLLMAISKPFCVVLSFILFLLPLLLFKNRFPLLLFFYSVSLLLILFFYFSNLNAARYYGAVYLIFIACMWLNDSTRHTHVPKFLNSLAKFNLNSRHHFFKVLLIIQAFAGITGYVLDLIRPFSGSREAAALILKEKVPRDYISGGCGAAPISAYLGEKIYYLNQKAYGSFCYFNKNETPIKNSLMLKRLAIQYVKETHRPAFLIAHHPIEILPGEAGYIQPFGLPAESALRNENYHIYKLSDGKNL